MVYFALALSIQLMIDWAHCCGPSITKFEMGRSTKVVDIREREKSWPNTL